MKEYKVTFLPEGIEVYVEEGTTLLDAAAQGGIAIRAVCGGGGVCKRCIGIIHQGSYETSNQEDLGERGAVLCCETLVNDNLQVEIPSTSRVEDTSVLLEGEFQLDELAPALQSFELSLPEPEFGQNDSDLTRLSRGIEKILKSKEFTFPLEEIKKIPDVLRNNQWQVEVDVADLGSYYQVSRVKKVDNEKKYGLAVDIGTTTVVVSLIELKSGVEESRRGRYNKQARYGDDIINRIVHAVENKNGLKELQDAVIETIQELIAEVTDSAGIHPEEILTCVCAGNTTMVHLFLGLNPRYIRLEPYVPAATAPPPVLAKEVGLTIHPEAWIHFLPGIGSYVGGDITAGLLATGVADGEGTVLFLDMGTNGELVLGNKDWLLTCACSAGPAFEGSGTKSGMRAKQGAVEKFILKEDGRAFSCKTIGGGKPEGICGTGFISLLSTLSTGGFLDRRGGFTVEAPAIRKDDGEQEMVLLKKENAQGKRDLVIQERDIKNLLRAKAAIFAGIRIMLKKLDLDLAVVEKILVAGGFGNHLPVGEAISIGLLPDLSPDKFYFVGNTSLAGAQLYLLSRQARKKAVELASRMTYLELSEGNEFTEEFVSAMFIPHTDFSLFPSVAQKEQD